MIVGNRLRAGPQCRNQILIRDRSEVDRGVDLGFESTDLGSVLLGFFARSVKPHVAEFGGTLGRVRQSEQVFEQLASRQSSE